MLKKLLFACVTCIGLGTVSVIQGSGNPNVYNLIGTRYANTVVTKLEDEGRTLHIIRGFVKQDSNGRPCEVIPDLQNNSAKEIERYLDTYYPSVKKSLQNIQEIILSPSIQKLGTSCFIKQMFPNLKEVYIENSKQSRLEVIEKETFFWSPLEVFGEKTSDGKKNACIRNVKNLKKIGQNAFLGTKLACFGLCGNSSLQLIIESGAFKYCENLRFFVVYNPIASIDVGRQAFYNNTYLHGFNLQAGWVNIGDEAFGNTILLTSFCGKCDPRNVTYGQHVFDIGHISSGPGNQPLPR